MAKQKSTGKASGRFLWQAPQARQIWPPKKANAPSGARPAKAQPPRPPPAKKEEKKRKLPRRPLLAFLPNGLPRKGIEIMLASIPGAFVLFFFMVAVGAPAIFTNSNWFTASYIPVTCLLPLVIGMFSPLALEWLRASKVNSLKSSLACATLSGLLGSSSSLLALFVIGALKGSFNPFGPSIIGLPPQLVLSVLIATLSTFLSGVGGAVLMLFIRKPPLAEGE